MKHLNSLSLCEGGSLPAFSPASRHPSSSLALFFVKSYKSLPLCLFAEIFVVIVVLLLSMFLSSSSSLSLLGSYYWYYRYYSS